MQKLLTFGLFGLLAQFVDGTLGMAYGVTSTTLLLSVGTAPAIASATVHLAEIGTTLASGTAHWRFGNVDWRTVGLMAVPGAMGAFAGAVLLSSLSAEVAEPWVAAILFFLGLYILARFTRQRRPVKTGHGPLRARFLAPLGVVAGTVDAMGGGGWGPIGTSSLLSSGRLEPRKVVGSIDTSEFLVTLGASAGFLVSLSFAEVNTGYLVALLVGGLIAAPVAAWLVRKLPTRVLGAAVGGAIVVTNTKTFGESIGVATEYLVVAYIVLTVIWIGSIASAVTAVRRDGRAIPEPA
ncbi:MAG TPA: sulfite exporter TauE/SafE family protein [Thermoleophilaceae bacterium]|nr:sulfite exporter TauE/SafE family protein [Thermoleophilaceae bacterium]